MSDILFTRKVSAGAVTRPQVANAATAAVGTVANLSASYADAAIGTLIKALVAAQNARGVTTLITDKGSLLLQTSQPLSAGNQVVLQLQSTGAQSRVLILSVDGKPLTGNSKPGAVAPASAERGGSSATTGRGAVRPPQAPSPGAAVTATAGSNAPAPQSTSAPADIIVMRSTTQGHPSQTAAGDHSAVNDAQPRLGRVAPEQFGGFTTGSALSPNAVPAPGVAVASTLRPLPDAPSPPTPVSNPAGTGTLVAPPNLPSANPPSSHLAYEVRGPLTPGLVVPVNVIAGANQHLPSPQAAPAAQTNVRPFVAGERLTIRILGITLAGASDPMVTVPQSRSDHPAFLGTLHAAQASPGASARGPTIATEIVFPHGRLSIMVLPPPAPGSRIQFEILDLHRPPAAMTAYDGGSYRDVLQLGSNWRSVKDVIAMLHQDQTGATKSTELSQFIAEPGPRMASALLSFMAALKTGDIRAWLGDRHVDDLLQSGRGAILGQLADDFTMISRHAADIQGSGWNVLIAPVYTGTHMEQVRMYYRRRRSSDSSDGSSDMTHFVVEANLSRIGLFSLEGLVRARQFDLVVHSAQDLGNMLQVGIRSIFRDTLNTGGLAGTIIFDSGRTAPFNPTGLDAGDGLGSSPIVV